MVDARLRNIDLQEGVDSSNVYTDAAVWNLYLFDIKMLTKLSGSLSGTFTEGDQVVGGTSGATGIVSYTTTGQLYVHDVVGTFVVNDAITTKQITCLELTNAANIREKQRFINDRS